MNRDGGEVWRAVLGYEGYYEVSSLGNVRSIDRLIRRSDGQLRRFRGRSRKAFRHNSKIAYRSVVLSVSSRRKTWCVHALVCASFHGPRPSGMEVRHLNGNPEDNRAENLTWGTQEENELDKVRHGTSRRRAA